MQNKINGSVASKGGYSLVEVSLALLVVAIGLTATFSLFPIGLQAAREAVNYTEVALFSEYIFNTLDLTASYRGEHWANNLANTDGFRGQFFRGPDEGGDFGDYEIRLTSGNHSYNVFYWNPDYYSFDGSERFDNKLFKNYFTAAFTYQLTVANAKGRNHRGSKTGNAVPKVAILKVWPGEFVSPAVPKGDPFVFYREILPYF